MPIVEQLQADREKQLERQKTIEENIGLVHACAHRFQGKGIEYDDLLQAGCMGLVKATDAFDTGRGVRFSTYAVPVILGEMRRLFRDGGTHAPPDTFSCVLFQAVHIPISALK